MLCVVVSVASVEGAMKSAELDEAAAEVAPGTAPPGRDDEVDEGGGEGASDGGCPTT